MENEKRKRTNELIKQKRKMKKVKKFKSIKEREQNNNR